MGLVRPTGVGGADDPAVGPGDHEQHAGRRPQDQAGAGMDPVPEAADQVHAFGRADVDRAAAADHGLDLIGPHAGGVDHLLRPDLQFGARLKVDRAHAGDSLPFRQNSVTWVREATWAPYPAAVLTRSIT